ncbi:LOW QUALITY PROTEIN: cilia- and flagella-associated protein 73-like [Spinachia spinachia]
MPFAFEWKIYKVKLKCCHSPLGRVQPVRAPSEEPSDDGSPVLLALLLLRRAEKGLDEQAEQRRQKLNSLVQPRYELHAEIKKLQDAPLIHYQQEEDAGRLFKEAQRERKVMLQLEAELERLKLVYTEEIEKKAELERLIQKRFVCKHFMQQAIGLTKFDNVKELTDHVENLLYVRDLFQKKEGKASEQVDRLRTSLVTLKSNRRLPRLEKNSRLTQLYRDIEKMRAETLHWESKWNYIQETTARKTLMLGRIKMATLNLYEMTIDSVEEDKDGVRNDTKTQLDKIVAFIKDHDDILEKYVQKMEQLKRQQKEPKSSVESPTSCFKVKPEDIGSFISFLLLIGL